MDWIVVGTPRQLLGAAEWVASTGRHRHDVHLTILESTDATTSAQLRALVDDDPWPRVEIRPLGSSSTRWALLRDAEARAGSVDTVVIGEYRLTLLRELVTRVRAREVVLTDDGNATLLVAHHRELLAAGGRGLPSMRLNGSRDSRRHLHRLVGLSGSHPAQVRYSTIYDVAAVAPDSVSAHGFDHLRSRMPALRPGGTPAILGSNIAESGIISCHHYSLLVERLVGRIGRAEYWPHRREDPAKVAAIAQQHGLVVRRHSTAVERGVFQTSRRPDVVAAVVSSAVDSFLVMFDDLEVITEPPPREMVQTASRVAMEIVTAGTARLAARRTSASLAPHPPAAAEA
jgi:hypothetical protein